MTAIPKTKFHVDEKVIVVLALGALVVCFVVKLENQRLKKELAATKPPIAVKKPCNCHETNTDKEVSENGG